MRVPRLLGLLAAGVLAGCGHPAAPPPPESARVALGYYEALLQQDWARAYAALDRGSQARCGPEAFAARARTYRRTLGFEPDGVHLRSCDEQGDGAVAHVVFTGRSGGRTRFHKDAVTLRKGGAGWGVVLPPRFGRPR